MTKSKKIGKHKFTKEECSKGGTKARNVEEARGISLNHGMLFGKRKNDDCNRINKEI